MVATEEVMVDTEEEAIEVMEEEAMEDMVDMEVIKKLIP